MERPRNGSWRFWKIGYLGGDREPDPLSLTAEAERHRDRAGFLSEDPGIKRQRGR